MVDATGIFLRIVGYHHEGFSRRAAIAVQQSLHMLPLGLVQPLQGLVQDIKRRILDEGAGHQAQALLAAGDAKERPFRQMPNLEFLHPPAGNLLLILGWLPEEAFRVEVTARNNVQRGGILPESTVKFRTHEADLAFDVPDSLASAAGTTEEFDVMGIGLGIVSIDETQERALATAVGAGQGPVLAFAHGPVQGIQAGDG